MKHRSKNGGMSAWKWLLGPWMLAVTLLAYVWAQPLEQFMNPESARIIFWHVPMAWLAIIWFWVGMVYAFRYLYGARRGDLELDDKVRFANELGLVCAFLATTSGMVFAHTQWLAAWNWDPKQVGITLLMLFYLAYFGLRMSVERPDLRGRLSAAYSILGGVVTPLLTYVVPQFLATSLHPGDTIARGLDPKWRIIYTMSALGFLAITVWLYQLRLRVATLEERAVRAVAGDEPGVRTEAVRRSSAGRDVRTEP